MMKTKLWIDDVRDAPDDTWMVARTSHFAMRTIALHKPDVISFDHDLGEEEWTGYDIAKVILNMVYSGMMKCPDFHVHSANPVGAANIRSCMKQAQRIEMSDKGMDTNAKGYWITQKNSAFNKED